MNNLLQGKTILSVSTFTDYSSLSIPETRPVLIMTDGTKFYFNGFKWVEMK
jgi:hypothetical protein